MGPSGHTRLHLPPVIRHLPALLGVALLFGAIFAAQKEFRSLRLIDIENAVADISPRALACALLVSIFSYALLTLYDRLGTIYAGCRVPYRRVAFASFCAYALAHNLGFATLSGGAVRFRLYSHWGLTPVQIAKTIAFCSLTFALGALTLGGIVLLSEPRAIPWLGQHLPRSVLFGAAAVMLAIVAGYLSVCTLLARFPMLSHRLDLPRPRMAVAQIALASADVAVTATILWTLLPHAPGLTWLLFLGVYIGSFTAGLAANVPGGLGVFDSAILFGLAPLIPADRVVAAILVFRFFYYVIPLFLAGMLFAANEALVHGPAHVRITEPDLAVGAATGTVALSGLLLLGVGVLSRRTPDLGWADPDLIAAATRAGQFVPSLIGAGLLVLGFGLAQRVRLAWASTIVLLMPGCLLHRRRRRARLDRCRPRALSPARHPVSPLLLSPGAPLVRFGRSGHRPLPACARGLHARAGRIPTRAPWHSQQCLVGADPVGPYPLGPACQHRHHGGGRPDGAVVPGASLPSGLAPDHRRSSTPAWLSGPHRRRRGLGRGRPSGIAFPPARSRAARPG